MVIGLSSSQSEVQGEALWMPERVLLSLGTKVERVFGSEVESGCYGSVKLLQP